MIFYPIAAGEADASSGRSHDSAHRFERVFGGEWFGDGGGVYSQVWAYEAGEDRWREASRMPTPRHGLGAVTLGDAIYTIGGAARAGGNETSARVEFFRPQ